MRSQLEITRQNGSNNIVYIVDNQQIPVNYSEEPVLMEKLNISKTEATAYIINRWLAVNSLTPLDANEIEKIVANQ